MRGFDYITNVMGAQNYTQGIESASARIGLTTRGKRKGVKFIIKVL